MNREELEKMFNEKFWVKEWKINFVCWKKDLPEEIKDFIFDTIIPKVLREISPRTDYGFCDKNQIKQKAKELYNINL